MIATQGLIAAPLGDARVSAVDVRDIADVAVAALTEPGHEGASYDLTGPEALKHGDMANRLSIVLERRVDFAGVTASAFRDTLLAVGMPAWQVDGLIEDYAHYARGEAAAVAPDVRRVTGHAPRSFDDFARDFEDAFKKPAPAFEKAPIGFTP